MAGPQKICSICLKPKTTSSGGFVTQFLGVCRCAELASSANQVESLKICLNCGKTMKAGRDGSLTQWIFRFDKCCCQRPESADESPKIAPAPAFFDPDDQQELELDPDSFPVERYKPKARLGTGASGTVYLAVDRILRKKVAVKILHRLTAQQLIAFQDEARTTSKLNHQGIIQILDFGPTQTGAPFMVLEFLEDIVSLDDYIRLNGALGLETAVSLFAKVCEALGHAHEVGVFHRDLKPSNILVRNTETSGFEIKIIDFGVASIKQDQTSSPGTTVVGTPAYLAPELAQNERYNSQSEIYSVGCVLFEALTRRPPFVGESALQTIAMHANMPPPSLTDLSEHSFPPDIEEVVAKCLAKKRQERYSSMQELKEALLNVETVDSSESSLNISAVSDTLPSENRNKPIALALVAGVLLAAVIIVSMGVFLTKNVTKRVFPAQLSHIGTARPLDEQMFGSQLCLRGKELSSLNLTDGKEHVSEVQIVDCNIVNPTVLQLIAALPELQRLTIENTKGLSEKSLNYLVQGLNSKSRDKNSNFRDLTLIFSNSDITDDGIRQIKNLRNIRLLSLDGTRITDSAIQEICHMNGLRALDISRTGVTDESLLKLGQIRNLVLLRINDCRNLTKQSIDKINKRITVLKGQFQVGRDIEFSLLYQAANNDNAEAQYLIGRRYHFGTGVKEDHRAARSWYIKAIKHGNDVAKNSLGQLYMNGGFGVEKNGREAMKWFLEAAEQGDSDAQNNIGILYNDGIGVPRDYRKALSWKMQAAINGNATAQNNVGFAYANGLGVPRNDREALKWFLKSAQENDSSAQCNLGYSYELGLGVPKDYNKAREYFLKAAAQGNATAQGNLGSLYDQGKGVNQDYGKALEWYQMAAEQGDPSAINNIGNMYEHGRGCSVNYAEAIKWYRRSAELGVPNAQNQLGYFYSHGLGVSKDDKAAFKWYQLAAQQEFPDAQRELGRIFEDGVGVKKDRMQALRWYRAAAKNGDRNSAMKLQEMTKFRRR